MNKDLIPTFEVGEKVIVHVRPYEWICPACKGVKQSSPRQMPIGDYEAIIEQKSSGLLTGCCFQRIDYIEGFYATSLRSKSGRKIAVPYTLLEKIDRPFLDFDSLPKNP